MYRTYRVDHIVPVHRIVVSTSSTSMGVTRRVRALALYKFEYACWFIMLPKGNRHGTD